MKSVSAILPYCWIAWGVITAALAVLVVYGNTLSMREDDQLYLNSEEQVMMGADQKILVTKMHGLAHIVFTVAAFSVLLFMACTGMWMWVGLSR